jgi:lipid-A-disaccharide synthase
MEDARLQRCRQERSGVSLLSMGPTFFVSSGEASGDLYGADLAISLRAQFPNCEINGLGGARMQQVDVNLWQDSRTWGAMGIVEAVRAAPRVMLAYHNLKRQLLQKRPDILIPIDFGSFNVPLCRWAKQQGIKIFYYMPPGSWRRDRQGKHLPLLTDTIATPFEWSARILCEMGANAHWISHPLLRLARPTEMREVFLERLGLDPDRPLVGFLPGSRTHEVSCLVPAFASIAEILYRRQPEVQFAISIMPHFSKDKIDALWSSNSNLLIPMETRSAYNLMAHADVLVCCSGTATLEAAIMGTPMLIVYRGNTLMNAEYRMRKKRLGLTYIGLPNLILNQPLCPEFIQDEVNPKVLSDHLLGLLKKEEAHQAQLEGFHKLRTLLSTENSTWEVVSMINQLLDTPSKPSSS